MSKILDVDLSGLIVADEKIVPIAVHCHTACNLVIWKPGALQYDETEWENIRIIMAKLMDRLADLLHDYQLFAPLVALVESKGTSGSWSRLTGDQDWHRGRFVIQSVEGNIKEAKERWLGPLMSMDYSPRRVTPEEFTRLLKEAVNTAKPPKGANAQLFSRYADNLVASVENGDSAELSSAWQAELLSDINSLLGKPLLEEIDDARYF